MRPRYAALLVFVVALVAVASPGCSSMQAPTAPEPPIITLFVAEPARVTLGASVTLRWDVSDGNAEVRIDPAVGNVPVTGHAVVTPAATTTYTLNARRGASSVQRVVTVLVTP